LLGLTYASGDLVVDGFVVGGFAAEETAESDDGVEFFRVGERTGGGRNLPGSGDSDDLDVGLRCSASVKGVERTLEEAVGDDRVPAGGDDGEAHVGGTEVAFYGYWFVVERVFRLPEAEGEGLRFAGCELHGEETGVPVGGLDGGEEGFNLFGAVAGEHPLMDGGVNGVEAGDLDEDGRDGGRAAGDELDVAQRGQESAAAPVSLRVAPTLAGLEAEGEEEASELVEGVGLSDCGD
jgi:hypothetical protein